VAVVAIMLGLGTPVGAADSGWTIDAFRSDIAIRPDGSLAVLESIDVDFDGLQKHGIFRDIPTRYQYDDTHDRLYRLAVQSVTDAAGRSLTYQVTSGDVTEIKIGDPGRTVSGKQSYRIRYTVAGALNAFADHDELYWNVNGDQWGVPTKTAIASVTAPAGAIQRATCFEGPIGSTESCTQASTADRADFRAIRPFAPGEQLTVVTALKTGAVSVGPPILTGRPRWSC
jgi:hypothetical protein